MSKSFALSTWVLFILLVQSVNCAQFLNITSLSLSSAYLAAWSAPPPAILTVPLTSIYVSR